MSSAPKSDGPLKPVVELPDYLRDLPTVGYVRRPARSREEAAQGDILFNVQSLDELTELSQAHFAAQKKTG